MSGFHVRMLLDRIRAPNLTRCAACASSLDQSSSDDARAAGQKIVDDGSAAWNNAMPASLKKQFQTAPRRAVSIGEHEHANRTTIEVQYVPVKVQR